MNVRANGARSSQRDSLTSAEIGLDGGTQAVYCRYVGCGSSCSQYLQESDATRKILEGVAREKRGKQMAREVNTRAGRSTSTGGPTETGER